MVHTIKGYLHMKNPRAKHPFHALHYVWYLRCGVQVEARVHMQGQSLHLLQRYGCIVLWPVMECGVAKPHLPPGGMEHERDCG